jgi:hypothetical protein
MGNILTSEDEQDNYDTNQQVALDKEEYARYQTYQREKERRYLQEQQQGVHRNTISNQKNMMNNIGQNNTYQHQIPLRHQIPDHVPTQFINHPQPSATNVNDIMNSSHNRDNSQTVMNDRIYRENVQRNYERPLMPTVQVHKSEQEEHYPTTQRSQKNVAINKKSYVSSSSLLGKIQNINARTNTSQRSVPQQQPSPQPQAQPQTQPQTQPQKSTTLTINKEILQKIDPFNVMTKEKLTIPQLRQKYKKLSLIHHPDRGGSIDNFNTLNQAIKSIDVLIKYHNQKQTHSSLKNNFKQDVEQSQKTSNVKMGKKFSINKFNTIYEKNQIQTRDNEGYGSLMGKRSTEREDINIKPISSGKVSKESFNQSFNSYKEKIMGSVEVHNDSLPEPSTLERELLYKELGDSKRNFTNMREGYMDFKQAHIDNNLVNTNIKLKQYKNIEDLEQARSTNIILTEEDKRLIKLEKQKIQEAEEYRQQTLEKNDRLMYERFKQSNKMLLG